MALTRREHEHPATVNEALAEHGDGAEDRLGHGRTIPRYAGPVRSWLVLVALLVALWACKSKDPAPAPKGDPTPGTTEHKPVAPRHVTSAKREAPRDPWPTGTFTFADELAAGMGTSKVMGTAHSVLGAIADPAARWAIVCQQRRDTNGDGAITIEQEEHFRTGDTPAAYLSIGGGPGIELQSVEAVSPTGDRLVVGLDQATVLLDVPHQTGEVIPHVAAATFTPDGAALVYIQSEGDRDRAIRRTLATGAIASLDLPPGVVGGVVATDTRWAVIQIPRGTGTVLPDDWDQPYRDWCSLSTMSAGPGAPMALLWIDFDRAQLVDDAALVRPFGDHRLTRLPKGLALDGKALAPTGCKNLDIIGVFPPTGAVLLQCFDTTKIYVSAPPMKPFTLDGNVKQASSPIPSTLDPTWCMPYRQCLDLATGSHIPLEPADEPPADPRIAVHGADYDLLMGAGDVGPLIWKPRPKKSSVIE